MEIDAVSTREGALQDERTRLAGVTLVEMASRDSARSKRKLFEDEKIILDDCFARGQAGRAFTKYHLEAVRSAIKADNADLARALLARDTSHMLLENDSDILQVALCVHEHHWYERSEDVLEMARILIKHGAKVNTFDDRGNTPLYYTCVHGLPEVIPFFIDCGSDWSTLHEPVRSDNGVLSAAPTPTPGKGHLLQVAVFALYTSVWIKNDISRVYAKWSPIIMFLVNAGLKVPIDNPAVIGLLRAACYEGRLDHVNTLLVRGLYFDTERKSVTNMRSPLLLDFTKRQSEGIQRLSPAS